MTTRNVSMPRSVGDFVKAVRRRELFPLGARTVVLWSPLPPDECKSKLAEAGGRGSVRAASAETGGAVLFVAGHRSLIEGTLRIRDRSTATQLDLRVGAPTHRVVGTLYVALILAVVVFLSEFILLQVVFGDDVSRRVLALFLMPTYPLVIVFGLLLEAADRYRDQRSDERRIVEFLKATVGARDDA